LYKLVTVAPTPKLGVSLQTRSFHLTENHTKIAVFIDKLLAGNLAGCDVVYISEDSFDVDGDLTEQFEKLQDALNISSNPAEVLLHYYTEDFDQMLMFVTLNCKKLHTIVGDQLTVNDIANELDTLIDNMLASEDTAITLKSRFKVPPKTIAVVGLHPGVGSTFVTLNLSAALASNGYDVTVVEGLENEPVFYEYLYGGSKLPGEWLSLHERLTTDSIQPPFAWQRNKLIVYPLPRSREEIELTEKMMLGLLLVKGAGFTIYDLSTNWNSPAAETVLDFVDEIWTVITPNPAKLSIGMENFKKRFERYYDKIRIFGNRWDDYAQSRAQLSQVVQLLQYNPPETRTNWQGMTLSGILPVFPADKVTRAEWKGQIYTETDIQSASEYFVDFYNILLPKRGLISKITDWAGTFRRK
jgi:hypothetical protein